MSKRKSKIKVSGKTTGIMIGIAITLSAIGIISALSVSSAHTNRNFYTNGMMDNDMMSMIHSMMMDENGGMTSMMECMEMMNQAMSDGKVTQAEMKEMMQQMDKDGDGNCDYCGMSIEACRRMISS